jgi:hypothetical protein
VLWFIFNIGRSHLIRSFNCEIYSNRLLFDIFCLFNNGQPTNCSLNHHCSMRRMFQTRYYQKRSPQSRFQFISCYCAFSSFRYPCFTRFSAVRKAKARIVNTGLTPPLFTCTEPSLTQRLSYPCTRPKGSVTDVEGSFPIRSVPA